VLILPHIANFDDLDPLDAEPAIEVVRVRRGRRCPATPISSCCPARKRPSPISPRWRAAGLRHRHRRASPPRRRGSRPVRRLSNAGPLDSRSDGNRGPAGKVEGLGLLDVETTLSNEKSGSSRRRGSSADGVSFSGYEMHMGVTEGPDCARPFARLGRRHADGAVSTDGRVFGLYIHGLFADDRQRAAWLRRFAAGRRTLLMTSRESSGRSMAWRRISRCISISIFFSNFAR